MNWSEIASRIKKQLMRMPILLLLASAPVTAIIPLLIYALIVILIILIIKIAYLTKYVLMLLIVINPCVVGFGNPPVCDYQIGTYNVTVPQDPVVQQINIDFMRMFQAFYLIAILYYAVHVIFMSSSPSGRAKAKSALMSLIVGMVLVSQSRQILQLSMYLSKAITDSILSIANQRLEYLAGVGQMLSPGMCCMDILFMSLGMVAVLMAGLRYFFILLMAAFFPMTLFLYFIPFTKNYGLILLRMTILLIFIQVIQAMIYAVTIISAVDETGFAGMMIAVGGLCALVYSPLLGMKLMGWIGAVTHFYSTRAGGAGTRFMAMLMRGGQPVGSAFETAGAQYSIGHNLGAGMRGMTAAPFGAAHSAVPGSGGAAPPGMSPYRTGSRSSGIHERHGGAGDFGDAAFTRTPATASGGSAVASQPGQGPVQRGRQVTRQKSSSSSTDSPTAVAASGRGASAAIAAAGRGRSRPSPLSPAAGGRPVAGAPRGAAAGTAVGRLGGAAASGKGESAGSTPEAGGPAGQEGQTPVSRMPMLAGEAAKPTIEEQNIAGWFTTETLSKEQQGKVVDEQGGRIVQPAPSKKPSAEKDDDAQHKKKLAQLKKQERNLLDKLRKLGLTPLAGAVASSNGSDQACQQFLKAAQEKGIKPPEKDEKGKPLTPQQKTQNVMQQMAEEPMPAGQTVGGPTPSTLVAEPALEVPEQAMTAARRGDTQKVKSYLTGGGVNVSDNGRRQLAEGLFGRKLSDGKDGEWDAVLAAHKKPGAIGEVTRPELRDKVGAMRDTLRAGHKKRLMQQPGMTEEEASQQANRMASQDMRKLIEAGICGTAVAAPPEPTVAPAPVPKPATPTPKRATPPATSRPGTLAGPMIDGSVIPVGEKTGGAFTKVMAIGDIHGNYSGMKTIMEKANEQGVDRFVFMGDYMDRGSQSLEVANEVFGKGGLVDQGKAVALLGNHDLMFLASMRGDKRSFETWQRNGGDKVLKQAGILKEGESQSFEELRKRTMRNKKLQELASNMQAKGSVYHVENKSLFVHSGLPINTRGEWIGYKGKEGLGAMQEMQKDLRSGNMDYSALNKGNSPMWSGHTGREFEWYDSLGGLGSEDRNVKEKALNAKLGELGVDRIVQGHKSGKKGEIGVSYSGKILNTDAHMVGGKGGGVIFDETGIKKYEHKTKKMESIPLAEPSTFVRTLRAKRTIRERIIKVNDQLGGLNSKDKDESRKSREFLAEGLNEAYGYNTSDKRRFLPDDFKSARFDDEYGAIYF